MQASVTRFTLVLFRPPTGVILLGAALPALLLRQTVQRACFGVLFRGALLLIYPSNLRLTRRGLVIAGPHPRPLQRQEPQPEKATGDPYIIFRTGTKRSHSGIAAKNFPSKGADRRTGPCVDQLLIHGADTALFLRPRAKSLPWRCSMRLMTCRIFHPYQRTARSRAANMANLRQAHGQPGIAWSPVPLCLSCRHRRA